jgi:hypothetical protein
MRAQNLFKAYQRIAEGARIASREMGWDFSCETQLGDIQHELEKEVSGLFTVPDGYQVVAIFFPFDSEMAIRLDRLETENTDHAVVQTFILDMEDLDESIRSIQEQVNVEVNP